jgi:Tol biopolymer transport system component
VYIPLPFSKAAGQGIRETIRPMKATVHAIPTFLSLFLFSVAAISAQSPLAKTKLKVVPRSSGGTIAYERAPEDSGPWPTIDIYSVNEDGTNDRALTHDGHSHSPSWSPDGRHILFVHDAALQKPDPYGPYREHGEYTTHHPVELYVMNRDGSDLRFQKRLEPLIDGAAWSPDSKNIAIQAAAAPPLGICLFLWSPEGQSEPRLLFPYPAAWPDWSPDGKKILFVKRYGPRTSSPFVADADGANATQLASDPGPQIFELAWSPVGKRIAYTQDNVPPSGTSQVFVMNDDGSGVRQLTHDPDWEYCRHPSWSPDGRRIAFSCTLKAAPCWSPIADNGTPVHPWCVVRLFVISPDDAPDFLTPLTNHYGAKPAFAPE